MCQLSRNSSQHVNFSIYIFNTKYLYNIRVDPNITLKLDIDICGKMPTTVAMFQDSSIVHLRLFTNGLVTCNPQNFANYVAVVASMTPQCGRFVTSSSKGTCQCVYLTKLLQIIRI